MHKVIKFDLSALHENPRGRRHGSKPGQYPWADLKEPGDGFRLEGLGLHLAMTTMASKQAKKHGYTVTVRRDGDSVIVVRTS